jgi:hypothetical protein
VELLEEVKAIIKKYSWELYILKRFFDSFNCMQLSCRAKLSAFSLFSCKK